MWFFKFLFDNLLLFFFCSLYVLILFLLGWIFEMLFVFFEVLCWLFFSVWCWMLFFWNWMFFFSFVWMFIFFLLICFLVVMLLILFLFLLLVEVFLGGCEEMGDVVWLWILFCWVVFFLLFCWSFVDWKLFNLLVFGVGWFLYFLVFLL